jgi:hypothetical protein
MQGSETEGWMIAEREMIRQHTLVRLMKAAIMKLAEIVGAR